MISVGIDVSKEKSTVCILKPYGEIIQTPYEIKHTTDDLERLVEMIKHFNEETKVVMEATGNYYLPVVMSLKEKGIFVSIINPLVMKKYARQALRKGKTDNLDSIKIASYGLDNWYHLTEWKNQMAVYEELKLLNQQYLHNMQLLIRCKLSLTNLLDRTMPGIKNFLKSNKELSKK